jgi:hypothetical protein
MKLTFSWSHAAGSFDRPTCESDQPPVQGANPIAHVLSDDGGLDPGTTLGWIEEGLRRTQNALNGAGPSAWGREAWGARIDERETVAYSLLDPTCEERLPTPAFLLALHEWLEFLRANPRQASRSVEIRD